MVYYLKHHMWVPTLGNTIVGTLGLGACAAPVPLQRPAAVRTVAIALGPIFMRPKEIIYSGSVPSSTFIVGNDGSNGLSGSSASTSIDNFAGNGDSNIT